jgi:uncharacterized membrane protein
MEGTRWRKAHWIVGVIALIIFVLSGSYMRWLADPPVEQRDSATRAIFRSRHIFLMLIAVMNLAVAAAGRPGRLRAIGSVVLLAAPVLLGAAFLTEPPAGLDARTFSTPALYSLFGAGVLLAIHGRK